MKEGQLNHKLEQSIRWQVETEFPDLLTIPGDFERVRREVDSLTLIEIGERGLKVPEGGVEFKGEYKVVGQLPTTTSAGLVCEGGIVIKTLREPSWRLKPEERISGNVFSDDKGHFLFPWEARDEGNNHVGIKFQEACLLGELRAGVLYNPENSPYFGLMGVKQLGNERVLLTGEENISAAEKIWPALVMKEESVSLTPAKVLLDWKRGEYPELGEEEIITMLVQSVGAYLEKAIPASEDLKGRYGSVEFFRRCLVNETPAMAANMDQVNGIKHNKVVREAAAAAKEVVAITEQFIEEHGDYFNGQVREGIVVGHADSKYSNTAIKVKDREELIGRLRGGGKLPLVILDAQSLAVNPGIMHGSEGIDFAHWRIVPGDQQLAYANSQLLGMGLYDIRDRVNERLGSKPDNSIREAGLLIQEAYKTTGVEPMVKAGGYVKTVDDGREVDELTRLTMEAFPQAGLNQIKKAAEIIGLSQASINAKLSR